LEKNFLVDFSENKSCKHFFVMEFGKNLEYSGFSNSEEMSEITATDEYFIEETQRLLTHQSETNCL